MNYKITTNTNSLFDVVETGTHQIIGSFSLQKEAKEYMRFLNLGGAFDGYTPNFLLKKVEKYEKKVSKVV
jgi:hypothetical protein